MRKLKLRLDDLSVSTFAADATAPGAGTVKGLADSDACKTLPTCGSVYCGYSVDYSCVNPTCAPACVTGYPDTCWVSWDPAARCAFPA